ncbi:hypothetical protein CYYG_00042 [Cyanophage SS120-1]|uniref:Uncharacterized protein n=1 Tax=Cyanophage SS120-1 TaxID=616674 RepID=M1U3C9_9CAUD|nr:hypothetical protein CYYG_00042 [Cyanophage SS120-1]AGG54543.1 hypothetical protein CYYG_00042 [Cyanophage SS120-1]
MASELSVHEVFGGQDYLEKLLEELDSAFPQVTPNPDEPLSKIMYRSGQRSVVEYLIAKKTDV